jgi:hypothetical protein
MSVFFELLSAISANWRDWCDWCDWCYECTNRHTCTHTDSAIYSMQITYLSTHRFKVISKLIKLSFDNLAYDINK